ncbi:TipJ family phage tail tip protein, partial [Escherichia coli]|uniref:TipJ family phage tail tip protein n=1 Tax=Escherichia coli TaxID=562 RepID=UPI003D76997A
MLVQIQRKRWLGDGKRTSPLRVKPLHSNLASVVVDNLPPRPFSIRMRRMTPDSTTDQLQNKNALVVIHRNYRCETV